VDLRANPIQGIDRLEIIRQAAGVALPSLVDKLLDGTYE
jgi:hypothetical protein